MPKIKVVAILFVVITFFWAYTRVPGYLRRSTAVDRTGTYRVYKNETINCGLSLTSNSMLNEHSDEKEKPAVDKPDEYFSKYFPRLNTKKMMIYTCTYGLCGGLGDRLRGLYSVYILSVFQNRRFGIAINKPCSIESFIQPNILDWKVPSNVSDNKTIGRSSLLDRKAPPLAVDEILKKVPDTDIVHLTLNEDYIDVFRFYKPKKGTFHKPGNETFAFLKHLLNSDIHRIIYHGLFQLTDPLEEELKQFFDKKVGDHKLISAHIRVGDTESRHSPEDLDKIWTFLIQYCNLSDYKLFIAADNQKVKNVADHLFGDQYVGFTEKIIHTDHVNYRNDTACQGHRFSLLEHAVLSRSDTLLLTSSGFGIEAAYIRKKREHLYCYLKTDGVIPCTPESLKALYKR